MKFPKLKINLDKWNRYIVVAIVALLVAVLAILSMNVIKNQGVELLEGGEVAYPTDYFTGFSSKDMEFKDGNLSILVDGDTQVKKEPENEDELYGEKIEVKTRELGITNELAINDFETVLVIPENLDKLAIRFICAAYYEAGNVGAAEDDENEVFVTEKAGDNTGCMLGAKAEDGSYYRLKTYGRIANTVVFDFTTGKFTLNADQKTAKDFTLDGNKLTVKTFLDEDFYLGVTAGEESNTIVTKDSDIICRKLKSIDGVTPAEIAFAFDVADRVNEKRPVDFQIVSIDQKASDTEEKYKQTFEINEYGELIKNNVYPIVVLRESYYSKRLDGSTHVNLFTNSKYTLRSNVYSLTGKVTEEDVSLECDSDDVWHNKEEEKMTRTIMIMKKGTYTFDFKGWDGSVYDNVTINAMDVADDKEAPKYEYDEKAMLSFMVALNNAIVDPIKGTYCPLGKNVNVPSMKDLVRDDVSSYENLSIKLYYVNPQTSGVKNTNYVETFWVGDYSFYLSFTDETGKKMNVDENNKPSSDLVFNFDVKDNAVPVILGQKDQETGTVGQRYYAYPFKVDAFGCSVNYTLWYNPDTDATESDSGWIEIPAFNGINREYEGDYTYEELRAIDFNGERNFTPDKLGAYMIKCEATSQMSETNRGGDFVIIKVEKEGIISQLVDIVKVNLWSYIFLAIGVFVMCCAISFYFLAKNKEKLRTQTMENAKLEQTTDKTQTEKTEKTE